MPRTIMQDIYRGTMEVEGEKLILMILTMHNQQDLDVEGVKDDNI